MNQAVDYPTYLQDKVKDEGPKRKGERTRDRLKVAAANILDKVSYQDLRVTDICKEAGVAPGTFYLYFENKQILTIEMLSEFVEMFDREVRIRAQSPFESIYHANLSYIQIARRNPGFFRCVLHMSDVEPEFARFHQQISGKWYERVTSSLSRWLEIPDDKMALLTTHALGSMMDDWVHRFFVAKDPTLVTNVKKLKLTDEEMAEYLSVIWYRAYFGKDPDKSTTDLLGKMPRAPK